MKVSREILGSALCVAVAALAVGCSGGKSSYSPPEYTDRAIGCEQNDPRPECAGVGEPMKKNSGQISIDYPYLNPGDPLPTELETIVEYWPPITNSPGFSVAGTTKDVDLQRADLQQQDVENRAQNVASAFSMDLSAARQLTVLSDRMQQLTAAANGQIAPADFQAVSDAALAVAGIRHEEVAAAYADFARGNRGAVNGLLTKAARNLGMPSSAGLRDQILPALGINLGAAQ